MQVPDVSYARSGEVAIAYQVVGAGSGLRFDARGEHKVKGIAGRWRVFAVVDATTEWS